MSNIITAMWMCLGIWLGLTVSCAGYQSVKTFHDYKEVIND